MVLMDIVSMDVSSFLEVDMLKAEGLFSGNVSNRLVRREYILMQEKERNMKINDTHPSSKRVFQLSISYATAQLQNFPRAF